VIVLTGLCLGVVALAGISLAIIRISWTARVRLPFDLMGAICVISREREFALTACRVRGDRVMGRE